MSDMVSPALVGELVVLLLAIAIVWIVFKEFMRIALRVIVPVAILTGLALWLGLLDETVVGDTLVAVGEGVLTGVRTVAHWITTAAFSG